MYRTKLIAHGRALQTLDGRNKKCYLLSVYDIFLVPGRAIDQNNRILAQQISAKRHSSGRRMAEETR